MSYFIHNEQCPKCRASGNDVSKDNLAVYSDDHKYCFRCGYYVPPDKTYIIKSYIEKPKEISSLTFPDTCAFTPETLAYLKRYGLTDEEIHDNLYGHEDGYAFMTSNFYLIRRLDKLPKVLTHGNVVGNEPVFLTREPSKTIVLCEDVLSAIKIARVENSCALLKTSVHYKLLWRLASSFDKCVLFLDGDMYSNMTKKLLPQVSPYFKETKIVFSERDPKELSTSEIKSFIDR